MTAPPKQLAMKMKVAMEVGNMKPLDTMKITQLSSNAITATQAKMALVNMMLPQPLLSKCPLTPMLRLTTLNR